MLPRVICAIRCRQQQERGQASDGCTRRHSLQRIIPILLHRLGRMVREAGSTAGRSKCTFHAVKHLVGVTGLTR